MLTILAQISLVMGAAVPAAEGVAARDVEQAARSYRITVYDRFRTDRPLYDHFIAAGDEVLGAWRNAEGSQREPAEVVEWFAMAQRSLLDRNAQELPPLPELAQDARLLLQEVSSQRGFDEAQQRLAPPPAGARFDAELQVIEPPLNQNQRAEHSDEFPLFEPAAESEAVQPWDAEADNSGQAPVASSVGRALWRAVTER